MVVIAMTENRWLSADEIGRFLGVKRETVYRWTTRKKVSSAKSEKTKVESLEWSQVHFYIVT